MKKTYFALLAMLCMSVFAIQAADWYPTNVVKVSPDPGGIPPSDANGALRDAVAANGSAIYELERGGVYYVNGTCAFGANVAIIRAAAGEGPRPIIIPFATGTSRNEVISSGSNIRFENLVIYGLEYGEGAPVRRGVARFTGGTDFQIEGCLIDGQSTVGALRFENLNTDYSTPFLLTINNSTIRNSVGYANVTNSRGIDFRDSKGISVVITNSTFYSNSAQLMRQGTTSMDSLIFKNNTVYGSATSFALDEAEKAVIKNNIFYNMQLNGSTTPPGSLITLDANPDIPRDVTIKYNLFYRDPVYDVLTSKSTTRFLVDNILNSAGHELSNLEPAQLVISDTLNYAVPFKNAPANLVPFYSYIWENNISNTAIPVANQTYVRQEAPGHVGDVLPASVTAYDFSYVDTHAAATAGEGGTPLGSAQWVPYAPSGLSKVNTNNNLLYSFNPISKNLEMTFKNQVRIVKVSLYNINGALISNGMIAVNGQKAEYQASGLQRGAYLFSVETEGELYSGKFVY